MEEPPQTQNLPPETPKPPAMSLVGRLANVIAAPGEAFDVVKNSPPAHANWLVPALLLIFISWLGAFLIFSQETTKQQLAELTEQAIQKQVERSHLSPEQAEQARQIGEKWTGISAEIGAMAMPVFIGFATPFLWGLFLWLLGAKAFKGNFTYMKAVEAVGLANVILVLDAVVRTLMVLSLNNLYASPSLMLLVVKDFNPQNTVHGLLSAVNVMTLWLLAARSIGLARLSGASFAKAAACVFGILTAAASCSTV